eukprot:SAG31_NODE_2281_length_6022_cov_3.327706_4_plen_81_part_00
MTGQLCVAKRDDLSGNHGKAAECYRKLSRNELAQEMGGQAQFLLKVTLAEILRLGNTTHRELVLLLRSGATTFSAGLRRR